MSALSDNSITFRVRNVFEIVGTQCDHQYFSNVMLVLFSSNQLCVVALPSKM